jgi:hypothetical protein
MKLITGSRPLWTKCLLLSIGLLQSFNSYGAGKTTYATADQLNAEIANRQQADATLQNKIDAETAARETATNELKSQVLYVVGLPGPAGGTVFYIKGGGFAGAHGLESAPVDQSPATQGWGCMLAASEYGGATGATGSDVGTGKQNTLMILEFCSESGIAAKIADNYVLNGFDDWFLPSIGELGLMYKNIGPGAPAPLTNVGGFISYSEFSQFYWSSTESDGSYASVMDFNIPSDGGGQPDSFPKDSAEPRVRAVRAF